MKNVLFLTGLFPQEIRSEIIDNSKYNTQFAADALQWSLVKGLSFYYPNMKVINMPFVGAYPNLYKTTDIKEFPFGKEYGFDGLNVSYINLIGFKRFDIFRKARTIILDWIKNTKGDKIILIYHAFLPFLLASINGKKKYADVKICLIMPDLPQYTGRNRNFLFKVLNNYNNKKLQECFKSVDSFVLLSKYMAEKLPIKDKHWVVIEGIYDNSSENSLVDEIPVNKDEKIILYTGTLHKKYGILNLLEAFKLLKNVNLRLVICGDGDSKNDIILAQKEDPRIIFKGSLNRDDVLNIQKQASLLVNARTSEGEYTKYSFPSKTMEYFASGVPTLLYKLPGIPEEYYDYCFSLEGESIFELSDKIAEILMLSESALYEIGKKAQQFIFENKNPIKQCSKICDLIEKTNK